MSSRASRGYIRIPDSQLLLERRQKVTNRIWHQHIMNLLLGKNVCSSCLRLKDDLVHWDTAFVLCRSDNEIEKSLKNIMLSTFGPSIMSIIPATKFCQECVDVILDAHMLIFKLRNNCKNIQTRLTEISQQMKWTDYLDETGALVESINNKTNPYNFKTFDNLSQAKTQSETITMSGENHVKTHKIILNNESLKTKLLQEPDMHKFLALKDESSAANFTETTLPTGITVRKVKKSVDMSDFAPQDLLELNWAEDEETSIVTDTQALNNKLHSNEALIMNLMEEEMKTAEKHMHFQENLKLQVNKCAQIPVAEQNSDNSLSVKLIQPSNATEAYDNDELVPQDLLELKWPDEQPCNTTHQTKIPVKKLNFNEALTVKFIPSHKLCKVEEGINEVAPHELLELNWNDDADIQNTNSPPNNSEQKHNIDLTQWLQDQGMSTIKSKICNQNESTNNLNLPVAHTNTSKRNNSEITEVISESIKKRKPSETMHEASNNNIKDLIKCNIIFKNSDIVKKLDKNEIRCGLCNLVFIQFESYWRHYKTHSITEPAKCYRCTAQFPVIELLVEHLLLMHTEDMAYCTLCYALLHQDKLAKHMVNYHAKKVEIINAPDSIKAFSKTQCKKCNQNIINSPNNPPHVCVFRTECTECKHDCVHEKYLLSYIEEIKANITLFKCPDCEYQYKTKQDIIRHANYAHLKHRSHQCKICNARFSLHIDLSNHSDSYHFRCRGCRRVFPDKESLDSHECPKILGKDLICEFCGEKFMALKCGLQHKQTALIVNDECVVCNYQIPNKCNMARHMKIVHHLCLKMEHNIMLYECTICQMEFKNVFDFKHHVCLYECKMCTKRFTVKVLYDKHMQAHLDVNESLKCSVCSEQLIDKYALAHHMQSHSDHEKCPVCFTYIDKNFLKQHIDSHEDPKNNLKCPHCSLVCENQNQFEVHVNRFHLLNRPYQCDLCKKSFYSKHKLREHIRLHLAELRPRPEQCPLCPKRFARKVTLQKHLKLHATGQLFDCDLCQKRYISAALLNEHRKLHGKHSKVPIPQTSQN